MNEKYNLKAIITALIIAIIGIIIVFWFSDNTAWSSIGSSLVASGFVILLQTLLVDKIHINELEKWGLERIYYTRAEQNTDTDPQLRKAKYKFDAVVFGLKSFRDKPEGVTEKALFEHIHEWKKWWGNDKDKEILDTMGDLSALGWVKPDSSRDKVVPDEDLY